MIEITNKFLTAPDMFADQSVRHEILPHADDVAFHVSLNVKVCTLLDTLSQ
jgi:hypothetical protein